MTMKHERRTYRVIKTLAPNDRGAIGYAQQYGERLVCVRHRADAKGKVRYTTVELLVQTAPIRARPTPTVLIRLHPAERDLHAAVRVAGGRWDAKLKAWHLPSRVASILNLRNRIARS
jgi:hypothetical protein